MPLELEPASVIKRTACNCSKTRKEFSRVCNSRTARRAKLQTNPPIGFIGTMFVGFQRLSGYLDVLLVEPDRQKKSAASSALAECAMTNTAASRLASHLVPNRTANTTTFMDLSHSPPPPAIRPTPYVRAYAMFGRVANRTSQRAAQARKHGAGRYRRRTHSRPSAPEPPPPHPAISHIIGGAPISTSTLRLEYPGRSELTLSSLPGS